MNVNNDATGNRISKTVTNKNTTDGTDKFVTTYYVRDPQGNVLAVISDKASIADEPTVVSLTDYYPYGMEMLGRSYSAGDYRYGFNGKEKGNMNGSHIDFGDRIYDTRVGRFFNVDPLYNEYPSIGSYVFCAEWQI